MRVPYTWLKEFVDLEMTAQELADLLTNSGIEVEEIITLPCEFSGVVVAEVVSLERHPQADKLFVARVYNGQEELTVVAGVDNFKAGDKVPLAMPGARLPGGVKIKRAKLRGVESCGMLCSAQELGLELATGRDGILVLDKDTPVGEPLVKALRLDDPILLLGLTPNRADCLGLLGVAHEVAALTGKAVRVPDADIKPDVVKNPVPLIKIEAPDLCSRYTGLVINSVSVFPSPLWMQVRLLQAGVRPISSVVDVTNYVMWEWGQPQHAFDYETITDCTIIVRRARPGEEIVTLDNNRRILTGDMLVIADSQRPVGLAGVMGGLETEITDKTKTVLLESAHFNPVSIRRTGRALGLYSEAQQRFEKGVDVNGCLVAAKRAARLMELIGCGRAEGEVVDEYVRPAYPRRITLRPERARKVIGLEISQTEMESIFRRQGFSVEAGTQIHVTVPTRRADLQEEIDLIEEVARIHGYKHIAATLPEGPMTQGALTLKQKVIKQIRSLMVAAGFSEAITYSFISPRHFDRLCLPENDARRRGIVLANPLSEEQSVMRTTLCPSLLDVVVYNKNRKQHDLKIFEIGSVYLPAELPPKSLPDEKEMLGMVITGRAGVEHWQTKAREVDFYDLKGVLEMLLARLGIKDVSFAEHSEPFLQPGQAARIMAGQEQLGWLGLIHPEVLDHYDLDKPVYAAELDARMMVGLCRLDDEFTPLPKYPPLLRDMALVVPDEVSAAKVRQMILETGGALVEDVVLFDLYRGPQIPENCRSLAFSIVYRDPNRTLTDEDILSLHNRIEETLKERLGATLRR